MRALGPSCSRACLIQPCPAPCRRLQSLVLASPTTPLCVSSVWRPHPWCFHVAPTPSVDACGVPCLWRPGPNTLSVSPAHVSCVFLPSVSPARGVDLQELHGLATSAPLRHPHPRFPVYRLMSVLHGLLARALQCAARLSRPEGVFVFVIVAVQLQLCLSLRLSWQKKL